MNQKRPMFTLLRAELLEDRRLLAVDFAAGTVVGNMTFSDAVEISGLATGSDNGAVLWSHNDSGNAAELFATDESGNLLGVYEFPVSVTNDDWEDIAILPDETGGGILYVGDIGDNSRDRNDITVYRVTEPDVTAPERLITANDVTPFVMTYADGKAHNAEALMVDPNNSDIYIVEKTKNWRTRSDVFQAEFNSVNDSYGTLTKVATIDLGIVVGGDLRINTEGTVPQFEILVMNDKGVVELFIGADPAAAFNATPQSVPHSGIGNTEAIAWDANGNYFTTSEGTDQPLYQFVRSGTTEPPTEPPDELTISVADVTVVESDLEAVFVISLSKLSAESITVHYDTNNGTAVGGDVDFVSKSGDVIFAPGDLEQIVRVPVIDDNLREKTETFQLVLSGVTAGAVIERGTATGTIRDDDRGGGGKKNQTSSSLSTQSLNSSSPQSSDDPNPGAIDEVFVIDTATADTSLSTSPSSAPSEDDVFVDWQELDGLPDPLKSRL